MHLEAVQIQGLAKSSLYQTNNQLKLRAEMDLTSILFKMPVAQYDQLLESSSEEAVLVVAAILRKNANQLRQHTYIYMVKIYQILQKWYHITGVLIRTYRPGPLKFYVLNTFGQFMGSCMKILFSDPQGKQMVYRLLDSTASMPHYQLFLYYCFIQSVSIIDGDTKYINHRSLLSSFQETLIPRIFEALHPYFMTISDSMEINELSFLQSELSMNQSRAQNRKFYNLSFSSQKNVFTEVVFKLLEQLINFRFNLSVKQYQDFDEFYNVMISFPESLLSKIIDKNFLYALYNILMQLMRTNESNYQQICLNCLKKILLAKITYISKHMQDIFVVNNLQGVFKLLQLISNQNYLCLRENIILILECNINFMNTFGLDKIIACSLKDEKHSIFFRQWLDLTTAIPVYLIQNEDQPITFENQLFRAGSQMLITLANQFKLHSINFDKAKYIQYYKRYTEKFIQLFIAMGTNINGSKVLSIEQFKVSCEFLSQVKIIMTYDYQQVFNYFQQCSNYLFYECRSQFSIGNFILLMRETIREDNFLEESIFGQGIMSTRSKQMQEDVKREMQVFGNIIGKTLQFILKYTNETARQFGYLNNAIIFFLSTLLDRCCKKLSTGNDAQKPVKPFIDYQVYKQLKGYFKHIIDDQLFLLECLDTLIKFISNPNITSFDLIFIILYQNIFIIKNNMKRSFFKGSKIYQAMTKFFHSFCSIATANNFVKSRRILFKTIATLSFDDDQDEYHDSVRKVIALLKKELDSKLYVNLLYDLTGIFQSVERQIIFKYFVRYFLRQLNFSKLLDCLFKGLAFKDPHPYLRDVLHLSWTFCSNQCNRLAGGNGANLVYQMLKHLIPYWNQYLQHGISINEEALAQMYLLVKGMFAQQHINICILESRYTADFRKFIILALNSMIAATDSLQSCPELAKAYFQLSIAFTKKVIKPLFNMNEPIIATNIHLLINTLMRKLIMSFQTITTGIFEQKLLKPMLETVNNYYVFLQIHKNMKHLKYSFVNIVNILSDFTIKQSFLQVIIKIAMEFRQHIPQTIEFIATLCVNLIDFYKITCESIVVKLGLTDPHDIKQLQRIFHHIRESAEENSWLVLQMKDWLRNKSRFCSPINNDY